MFWFRLFLPFAGAYFLSYHFRTINAVVGPILSAELSLGAADLGLLTSTYFIAFGAAQLPLGLFSTASVHAVSKRFCCLPRRLVLPSSPDRRRSTCWHSAAD